MQNENKIIRGLWIGKELSPIEILCIKSYLQNGHEFELYIYDHIKSIPDGTIIKDANRFFPRTEMLTITSTFGSRYALFSDLFRYKLLFEKGGWWSDLDAICIKPFDMDQEYIFMQHKYKGNEDKVCSGVIKCPVNAPIMDSCFNSAKSMIESNHNLQYEVIGPAFLAKMVKEFGLEEHAWPPVYFSPIAWYEIKKFLKPYVLDPSTYSIHLYNEVWTRYNVSKYGIYSKNSIIGMLMQKHAVPNNYPGLIKEALNGRTKKWPQSRA